MLAFFLESLKIFNIIPFGDIHYLALIRPIQKMVERRVEPVETYGAVG